MSAASDVTTLSGFVDVLIRRWIIGAVNNAAMNALHPLAVYAAVQAHKGETLDFPGSLGSWMNVSEHSTAMLTGYLTEWAALNEHCKDQKFNASDTSPVSAAFRCGNPTFTLTLFRRHSFQIIVCGLFPP